jgi:hypothetical protein
LLTALNLQRSDKEMTEVELVQAANSSWSLAIRAYLITAFVAGVKLTTSQMGIISALFITMTTTLMMGLHGWAAAEHITHTCALRIPVLKIPARFFERIPALRICLK